MSKKIILICLLTALVFGSGCTSAPPEPPDGTGTAGTVQTTEPPVTVAENMIELTTGETALYAVIVPYDASETVAQAGLSLRTAVERLTGAQLPYRDDSKTEQQKEILIGRVGRRERVKVSSEYSLKSTEYVIKVYGEKIVILGGSDKATAAAVEYFIETVVKAGKSEKLQLNAEYCHSYTSDMNAGNYIYNETDRYIYFSLNADADGRDCRLGFTGNHGWRIQTSDGGEFTDIGASQQLALYLDESPAVSAEALTVTNSGTEITVTATDGSRALINTENFGISFYSASGKLSASVTGLAGGRSGSSISGGLLPGEAIFGSGERFDSVNQRGKKLTLFALDEWNTIGGNGYMPIPVFLSSRGSGVFVNRYEMMEADLGKSDSDKWSVSVDGAPMDCYIFATDELSDVLYGYSALSGFASMPEDWTFGVLVCRYSPDFTTAQGIYDMIDNMEKHDLPWTAVMIEGWPIYDTTRYDELKEVVRHVHSLGKKVLAYSTMGRVYTQYTLLPSNSYLVSIKENGSTRIPNVSSSLINPDASSTSSTSVYVDITNPAAADWWFGTVWGTLINDIGIDGCKIDFCEQLPDSIELKFDTGSSSGAHHWFPTLYISKFCEMFTGTDGGMVFARGGGIGSQRNPFMWAGDQTREFSRLEAALRAVLSSGMSGVPFMSYDMAGYRPATNAAGNDEATVFTRGVEMTCFTACIQTHGTVTRPYDFPESTVDIYRAYTKLHELLVPYISECAAEACKTGMPVVRHLALEYQNDPNVYNIDDEFMLGDALLVAPVLDSSLSRDIYLPEGVWTGIFTGETYNVPAGGTTLRNVSVPIGSIPVFRNMNSSSAVIESVLQSAASVIAELSE